MKPDIHFRIISTIIAFSLLFLGLYNQNPILAASIRIIISLLIIIYFIIIWMRTKKLLYFISSMLLPLWLLILIHPGSITDYLFVLEEETPLREIAQLIQSNSSYEKLNTYSLLEFPNSNKTAYNSTSVNLLVNHSETYRHWHKISSTSLALLLKQSHLTGFEVGHGSILFYLKNNRRIRFYFNENDFIYLGNEKIKSQWYHVP